MKRLTRLAVAALMCASASAVAGDTVKDTSVSPAAIWLAVGQAGAVGQAASADAIYKATQVAIEAAVGAQKAAAAANKMKKVAVENNDTPAPRGEMEVQVFEGAGVRGKFLGSMDVVFNNGADAPRALPQGDAQWQAYWDDNVAEYKADRDAKELRPGDTSSLRGRTYVQGCTSEDYHDYIQGTAVQGGVSQGGVNAGGQRWAHVALRSVELEPTEAEHCWTQTPRYTEVRFEGVLDSNPEQNFIVQQAGKTYTFRFINPSDD